MNFQLYTKQSKGHDVSSLKSHGILEYQNIWNVLCLTNSIKIFVMQNWLKTLIAGYAGWKWGGGCLGFIAIFAIVYFLLGKC